MFYFCDKPILDFQTFAYAVVDAVVGFQSTLDCEAFFVVSSSLITYSLMSKINYYILLAP